MKTIAFWAAALLSLALSTCALEPAAAQSTASLSVKDGTGTTQSIGAVACRTNVLCYEHATIDTTGAQIDPATKQLQQSTLSALGSPFQAGGSIGNASFGATQSGAWNITNVSGTVSLPTGAATASAQASQLAALNQTTPSTAFAGITPSDSTALATLPKALFIGTGGNLTVKGSDGVSATFAVATGQILPIRPTYVMATGTTASGIVALN